MGFFSVIALFILFIGKGGNGGQQTAAVLGSLGSGLTQVGVGLETGSNYGQ